MELQEFYATTVLYSNLLGSRRRSPNTCSWRSAPHHHSVSFSLELHWLTDLKHAWGLSTSLRESTPAPSQNSTPAQPLSFITLSTNHGSPQMHIYLNMAKLGHTGVGVHVNGPFKQTFMLRSRLREVRPALSQSCWSQQQTSGYIRMN